MSSKLKVSYTKKIYSDEAITSADKAAKILYPYYKRTRNANLVEHFFVLYLDKAHNLIAPPYHLSQGGMAGTVVDIKLVLGTGLTVGCSSIIVSHNHPSGNDKASTADIQLTRKLSDACKLLDISLVDHLIFLSNSPTFVSII